MKISRNIISWSLIIILLSFMFIHLNGGFFGLKLEKLMASIFDFSAEDQSIIIFRELRIPRTVMAVLAGSGLSIAGLLMQTLFKNPLAGPSVLGITSGASLCVAIAMLTGISFLASDLGIVTIALIGSLLFSLILLFFSLIIRNQISLLLIGMMLGSFTSAIVQVLQVSSQAEQLKAYTIWGLGSMQQVSFDQLPLIILVFILGLVVLFFLIKPLNILVIGEKSTQLLGVKTKTLRILIITVTSIFAGLITAYCGPISFVGLAVPNVVKVLYKTQNHVQLIMGSALIGAISLIFCDLVVLWIEPWFLLPLNAVTALVGAPVVVWIILKRY